MRREQKQSPWHTGDLAQASSWQKAWKQVAKFPEFWIYHNRNFTKQPLRSSGQTALDIDLL